MTERKSDFECQAKLRMSLYALRGSDHENFGELLNTAYSTEKGREVMNAVAFRGYKFIYDALPGLNGVCDFENKVVKLGFLSSSGRTGAYADSRMHARFAG